MASTSGGTASRRLERIAGIFGRVVKVGAEKLDDDKRNHNEDDNDLQNLFQHARNLSLTI